MDPPAPGAPHLGTLATPHRLQPDAVLWAVGPKGVSINGLPPVGTPGRPLTVSRVLASYSVPLHAACAEFAVPLALMIAVIAGETGAYIDNPAAQIRKEPGYVSNEVTPHRISIGCCQTLLSTARDALDEPTLHAADLFDPLTSIRAGAATVGKSAHLHLFDPPLVAACYNAGGLYRDPAPQNRWRLRCFPLGTGAYIDRFVAFYNDSLR